MQTILGMGGFGKGKRSGMVRFNLIFSHVVNLSSGVIDRLSVLYVALTMSVKNCFQWDEGMTAIDTFYAIEFQASLPCSARLYLKM